jgi:hypothetical protein
VRRVWTTSWLPVVVVVRELIPDQADQAAEEPVVLEPEPDLLLRLELPIPSRSALAGQVEPAMALPAQIQCFRPLLQLAGGMVLLHLHHPALQGLLALADLGAALVLAPNPVVQEILPRLPPRKVTTAGMRLLVRQTTVTAVVVVRRLLEQLEQLRLVVRVAMALYPLFLVLL